MKWRTLHGAQDIGERLMYINKVQGSSFRVYKILWA